MDSTKGAAPKGGAPLPTMPEVACGRVAAAERMGETAVALLSNGSRGIILACVSQVIYLLDEAEELLWIATSTVPLHRRGIRILDCLPAFLPGMPYHSRDGHFWIESSQVLDIGSAATWHAPRIPAEKVLPLPELRRHAASVAGHFQAWPKAAGANAIISTVLAFYPQPGASHDLHWPEFSDPITPVIFDLVQAVQARQQTLLQEKASRLVGLGPGLTPSGDDFLGGLFFGLANLRCFYPQLEIPAAWNFQDFILRSQASTHLISFNLLKDYALGQGIEPLHLFMNALLLGASLEETLPYASELVTIGHSTGWDLLAGLLASMSVIYSR